MKRYLESKSEESKDLSSQISILKEEAKYMKDSAQSKLSEMHAQLDKTEKEKSSLKLEKEEIDNRLQNKVEELEASANEKKKVAEAAIMSQ